MRYSITIFSIALVVILQQSSFCQEERTSNVTFIPGEIAVPPLTASYQEPRVGLRKEAGNSQMKLDIGAAVDMVGFQPAFDSTALLRMGIDFFTYALSTSSEGLRLQIDAVDGYFGGHVAYKMDLHEASRLIVRLRLLHLSAHFLDGHYDTHTQTWKDNRSPIPFTRDFGELLGMYEHSFDKVEGRFYCGFSYATLVRPDIIKRFEPILGLELHSASVLQKAFGRPFNVYLADHFVARGIPDYVGTNNLEFGVKFGSWTSTGLKLYFSYYAGLEVFSQYYNVRTDNFGIGFAVDFW